jgi:hypothetical protein
MADTVLDGSGEHLPGRRPLDGTDLEIAYELLGDDLVLRVNKAGVQVFGVVLESAGRTMTGEQLLELNAESSGSCGSDRHARRGGSQRRLSARTRGGQAAQGDA